MSGQRFFLVVLGVIAAAGGAWLLSRTVFAPTLPVTAVQGTRDTTGFQGYVMGSADAPVEVVEYGDYQCPACANWDQVQFPTITRQLISTGKLRFRYRDFPLSMHSHSRLAAHAAACADDQGKYWPMHEALFRSQTSWAFDSERGAYGQFGDMIAQLGGDRGAWESCMEAGTHAARIEASYEDGVSLGIGTTPTMLLDNKLYPGGWSSDSLAKIVNAMIAERGATP
jgi:protein-disulfide isomerase